VFIRVYPWFLFLLLFTFSQAQEEKAEIESAERNREAELKRVASAKLTCFLLDVGEGTPRSQQLDYEYGFGDYCVKSMGSAGFFESFIPNLTFDKDTTSIKWDSFSKGKVKIESTLLAIRDQKKIVRYTYAADDGNGLSPYAFILVRESAEGWCRPFLIAKTEDSNVPMFKTTVISKRDLPLAITATLSQAGTGAYRCHILIDVSQSTPRLVASAIGWRPRSQDYSSDKEYREDVRAMVEAERIATGGSY